MLLAGIAILWLTMALFSVGIAKAFSFGDMSWKQALVTGAGIATAVGALIGLYFLGALLIIAAV